MAKHLTVQDLLKDSENANAGTVAGAEALNQSLEIHGVVRPIATDKNGKIIAGNQTQRAALRAGIAKVIEVESDGESLIVHKRLDLDFDSPDPAIRARTRGASLADNQIGKISQNVDMEKVREQIIQCNIVASSCGFTQADIISSASMPAGGEVSDLVVPEVPTGPGDSVKRVKQVVVDCPSDEDQQDVYEMLSDHPMIQAKGLTPELRTL